MPRPAEPQLYAKRSLERAAIFGDEQVVGVLKKHEAGGKVGDICRRHAISATFYSWRKKYGSMEANDTKRLRELEAENTKLKRIVADQVLCRQ